MSIAEIAFLYYVIHFGRKAVAAGETGDVEDAPDVVPTGLEPAAGLHRQIVVGQRGCQLIGRSVDDVDPVTSKP